MRLFTNLLTAAASIACSWGTGTVEFYSRVSECQGLRKWTEIQLAFTFHFLQIKNSEHLLRVTSEHSSFSFFFLKRQD